jgi:hypothetical protein
MLSSLVGAMLPVVGNVALPLVKVNGTGIVPVKLVDAGGPETVAGTDVLSFVPGIPEGTTELVGCGYPVSLAGRLPLEVEASVLELLSGNGGMLDSAVEVVGIVPEIDDIALDVGYSDPVPVPGLVIETELEPVAPIAFVLELATGNGAELDVPEVELTDSVAFGLDPELLVGDSNDGDELDCDELGSDSVETTVAAVIFERGVVDAPISAEDAGPVVSPVEPAPVEDTLELESGNGTDG